MFARKFWQQRIEDAWSKRSVVWLMGVRRVGKTVLCRSLPHIEYFDAELPSTRRQVADPEGFLAGLAGKRVVIDEIHRLPEPSELLKVAADHFKNTRVLATGSSTLGASSRFRDTLAGRKQDLWLTPMTMPDLEAAGNEDLHHRMLHGGLPPFFLAKGALDREFQEWLEAYWAKDVLELFRLERRHSFLRFAELLLAQSGGMFEATRFTRACEVSRTTIMNYLAVLEATFVVHVLRPYSSGSTSEIVAAPKVYAFDTGFACHQRGWSSLRSEDLGSLYEHLVMNELHAHFGRNDLRYWRDKQGHEIDLVLVRRGKPPLAIECKWSADHFEPAGLKAFRNRYAKGESFVVAHDVVRAHARRFDDKVVQFVNLQQLVTALRP